MEVIQKYNIWAATTDPFGKWVLPSGIATTAVASAMD